jgi:hypothetical protein
MKKMIRPFGLIFLIMIISFSCYDSYQPPGVNSNTSYLVVDAFVNTTDGTAIVKLSHTIPLSSNDTLDQVNAAAVALEDESGNSYVLNFEGDGLYQAKGLDVSSLGKSRLVISFEGKKYQSDFVAAQNTPPIDTVGWAIDRNYLNINVSTHNAAGSSRFYRWKYTETWEYTSKYLTPYIVKNDSVWVRTKEENMARCWRSENDKKITIYNTAYLSDDVVSNFTVQKIPSNSIKLSSRYTILVQQQTLTKEAYAYWENVKKTTESLGGLYDPLPGAVPGNIHSVTDPSERVIGYFSIGSVSAKRIYISRADLVSFINYQYPVPCQADTIVCDTAHLVKGWYTANPRLHFSNPDGVIAQLTNKSGSYVIGYVVTTTLCTDCRQVGGGKTTKPVFWKD